MSERRCIRCGSKEQSSIHDVDAKNFEIRNAAHVFVPLPDGPLSDADLEAAAKHVGDPGSEAIVRALVGEVKRLRGEGGASQ